MKNIHVLPTDQPSRLFNCFGRLDIAGLFTTRENLRVTNQNIYITSENECINENDYIITKDGRLVQVSYLLSKDLEEASKVVLTTDQDLIKDGVQAIDDDFLEWFVKNPSCERVYVKNKKVFDGFLDTEYGSPKWKLYYKIIIPKEEPKQDLEKEMFELEQELDIPSHLRWHNSKPKQETLEEAKKRILDLNYMTKNDADIFEMGVKWQQEQDKNKYSDEKINKILQKLEEIKIMLNVR